jgi:uncharacterized protein (DUF1778 family)
MSPRKTDQKEIRITVSQEVYSLLKRIAGIKESSMNKVVVTAVERFLEDNDTKELIEHHKLED